MLSYVLSKATSYFHLPVEDDLETHLSRSKSSLNVFEESAQSSSSLSSTSAPTSSSSSPSTTPPTSRPSSPPPTQSLPKESNATINEVLSQTDLYRILGIQKSHKIDKLALRRAYLARSRACHPDKFANNPEATRAFQKVSVAYDVLSKPASKRMYDARQAEPNIFAARQPGHADETFRSALLGVLNDFLDGDLEMVRTLLRAVNDVNPSLKLGDESVDSILLTVQSIRDRAITCRTCILALHVELMRLLELEHACRQLSYFDLLGRTRLTLQIARVALNLPIAIEQALQDDSTAYGHDRQPENTATNTLFLPQRLSTLLRTVIVVLERMERIL